LTLSTLRRLAHRSTLVPYTTLFRSRRQRWSGRRGSNPLPQPWEGRALPDELLPLGRPSILGLDNSLGLRGGLGHDGPHELRVLLDEPVRVPGVRRRRDDVVLRPVRVGRDQDPPVVDEQLHAVGQVDPVLEVPLHHRAHYAPLHLPWAELDRRAVRDLRNQ